MIKDKLKDRLVDVANIIGSDIRDVGKQMSGIIRNELTIEPLIKGIVAILCSSRFVNAQMKVELRALDVDKMTDKESIRSIIAVLRNHRANLQVRAELMVLDAMIAEIEDKPAKEIEEPAKEMEKKVDKSEEAVAKDKEVVKEKKDKELIIPTGETNGTTITANRHITK